jgi:hypothetical protein
MVWLTSIAGFLGGIVGAGIAAFAVMRINSRQMAADIQARWDEALLDKSSEFAAATRSLRHLAERYDRIADEEGRSKQSARLDEAHEQLRILSEQLRLVGDQRVQVAARLVQHEAYAVRVEGEEKRDPRAEDEPEKPPVGRLNDALQEFYRSVREQLRAPDPEGVIHADDLEKIAKGLKPLTWRQRSSIA